MRREFILGCAVAVLLAACNQHPLKEVEYDHFTGAGDGDTSTSTTGYGTETGSGTSGEETETGDLVPPPDLPQPECGNGVIEGDELCDDGVDNGPYPAPCSDDCWPNGPQ